MGEQKPKLEYETSEFVTAPRRWLLWPTITLFVVGYLAGFIGIVVVMPVAGSGKSTLSLVTMAVVPIAVGVAFAAVFGREPRRRRVPRLSERIVMIRCRDCGQLTPHMVRLSSPGQCTVECTECAAKRRE